MAASALKHQIAEKNKIRQSQQVFFTPHHWLRVSLSLCKRKKWKKCANWFNFNISLALFLPHSLAHSRFLIYFIFIFISSSYLPSINITDGTECGCICVEQTERQPRCIFLRAMSMVICFSHIINYASLGVCIFFFQGELEVDENFPAAKQMTFQCNSATSNTAATMTTKKELIVISSWLNVRLMANWWWWKCLSWALIPLLLHNTFTPVSLDFFFNQFSTR